jgi:putative tryptophan/tyrosine transport system substrate-binding protein
MKRRAFITLLGGAAVAWPLAARAQQPERMRRIGVLVSFVERDPDAQSYVEAVVKQLQELGWTEGRNIVFDYRWDAAERNRAQALAKELIDLQPDLVVACAGPAAVALWEATRSVPIVFAQVTDPVALGMAASLAAPGRNATGFTHFEAAIGGKWLELLKEITPKLSRVAVIFDPNNPSSPVYLGALKSVYPNFRVQLTEGSVSNASEIEQTLDLFSREPNGGLIVLPNPLTQKHRDLIIALAARDRLPVIYPHALYAKSGGLMTYGTDLVDMYRRMATYIDRILKGAKPADLPVQGPTKYELVINLKTAKALGLEVPPTLLARADEVIE